MTTGAPGDNRAEDLEAIRLAKARLVRICRMNGQAAEQALARAATDQRSALVAVAMRVLAASPEDLAAGRVLEVGRPMPQQRHRDGQRYQKRPQRPQQRWQGKPRNKRGRR
jgi:hypothetical protein